MAVVPIYLVAEYVLAALATAVVGVSISQHGAEIAAGLEDAYEQAKDGLQDIVASDHCQECEPCTEKIAEVTEIRDELKRRYNEMREDKMDLYNTRRTGPMSWQGHVIQFKGKQGRLRNKLHELPPNCPPPPDAWEWATKEPPSQPAPRT